jgi:hypothetical protein
MGHWTGPGRLDKPCPRDPEKDSSPDSPTVPGLALRSLLLAVLSRLVSLLTLLIVYPVPTESYIRHGSIRGPGMIGHQISGFLAFWRGQPEQSSNGRYFPLGLFNQGEDNPELHSDT